MRVKNVQAKVNLGSLSAEIPGSCATVYLNLQSATVNFVVLGKLYNIPMSDPDGKGIFMVFANLLEKDLFVFFDGEYEMQELSVTGLIAGNCVSRLLIMDKLPLFRAIAFKIFELINPEKFRVTQMSAT